jgi:hypothetical protein
VDNLIKPFHVYKVYYPEKGFLASHRSHIISHCLEDLYGGTFILPDSKLEISNNIRCDYNLQDIAFKTAFKTSSIPDLRSSNKLNYEEFYTFYDKYKQSKDVSAFKIFGAHCYMKTDNLLDLIMLNWDEWN